MANTMMNEDVGEWNAEEWVSFFQQLERFIIDLRDNMVLPMRGILNIQLKNSLLSIPMYKKYMILWKKNQIDRPMGMEVSAVF